MGYSSARSNSPPRYIIITTKEMNIIMIATPFDEGRRVGLDLVAVPI